MFKPLNNSSEWKNKARRNLQRAYLANLDKLINQPEKTVSTARTDNSDVLLYLLQHLEKVEKYLKTQQNATGINQLHYQDLQERAALIREQRKTPRQGTAAGTSASALKTIVTTISDEQE